MVLGALGGLEPAEQLDDAASDLGGHRRSARRHFAHALDEIFGGRLLQQIATGARAHRLEDALVIVVHRDHQDEDVGIAGLERLDTGDTGHAAQADVEQRHGWWRAEARCERLLHRSIAADTANAGRAIDQPGQSFANLALVLDDDDVDRAWCRRARRLAVPWPLSMGRHDPRLYVRPGGYSLPAQVASATRPPWDAQHDSRPLARAGFDG